LPATATACSKATARQLVKKHHLNDFLLPNPVVQVLCGPFTGSGSEAMAITIGAPTCWGTQRWVVFRFTGGVWQLVLDQRRFIFPLVAVGSDIRETAPVFRPGDARCLPSGGKHSRLWHWNGSRLVAGPWKQSSAGTRMHLSSFLSPSRNIWCRIIKDATEDDAWCASKVPRRLATLKRNGAVAICTGTSVDPCFQNWDTGARVLRYGQQDELNGFRCKSETKGITCTVAAPGKGFLINRAGVQRVG